jgi:hypothetical protein
LPRHFIYFPHPQPESGFALHGQDAPHKAEQFSPQVHFPSPVAQAWQVVPHAALFSPLPPEFCIVGAVRNHCDANTIPASTSITATIPIVFAFEKLILIPP